jgi:pimeloyl-[acyl-carrier protein] methyl ester esterase
MGMSERAAIEALPTLLFVHGWAFDGSVWDGVRARLAALGDWPHAVADAGYFAAAVEPSVTGPVVAIGHSYGTMRLLAHPPADCLGLIAVNGFTRFAEAADFPQGVPGRLLDRMLAKLRARPSEVVNDFRARCGAGPVEVESMESLGPTGPRLEPLERDLRALRADDRRVTLAESRLALLALAGDTDPIVPAAMTHTLFEGTRTLWRAGAGHLLPLTDPDWCAERIAEFARAATTRQEERP